MWHFGTLFSRHGGAGWMVGLDDLRGLFQPYRFYDSMKEIWPVAGDSLWSLSGTHWRQGSGLRTENHRCPSWWRGWLEHGIVQVRPDLRRSQFEVKPRWLRSLSSQVLKFPKDGDRPDSLCEQFLPRLNYRHEEKFSNLNLSCFNLHALSFLHCVPLWRYRSVFLQPLCGCWGCLVHLKPSASAWTSPSPSYHNRHILNLIQSIDVLTCTGWPKLGVVLLQWTNKCWVEGENLFLRWAGCAPVSATQEAAGPLCCHGTAGSCSACCQHEELKLQRNTN